MTPEAERINKFLGQAALLAEEVAGFEPRLAMKAILFGIGFVAHENPAAFLELMEKLYRDTDTELVAEMRAVWEQHAPQATVES